MKESQGLRLARRAALFLFFLFFFFSLFYYLFKLPCFVALPLLSIITKASDIVIAPELYMKLSLIRKADW